MLIFVGTRTNNILAVSAKLDSEKESIADVFAFETFLIALGLFGIGVLGIACAVVDANVLGGVGL
jgi:hypothetical protein